MKTKNILLIVIALFTQLSIVAQDGNTVKTVAKKNDPKKEKVAIEGNTGNDKIAEYEALKKSQKTVNVETVTLKKGKANVKREESETKTETDPK